MLSIIVPTLNEEKYLPLLLESLKNQDFKDMEIIVADAGSKDKTKSIAQKYNCRVVKGGLPAEGKNLGAEASKGKTLLFLDADTVMPEYCLLGALAEFEKRKLKMAAFRLVVRGKNKFGNVLTQLFYNFPIMVLEEVLPHAAGGIIIEKDLFTKLGGFDASIKLAEDHDLARRAKKAKAKIGVLRSSHLFISDRRFEKEGWVNTSLKYLMCEFHMIFKGPVRSDVFKYRYDHYLEDKED